MKSQIKKLPKSQIEFTIEINSEELDPYLDQAASNISKNLKIKGFRPGKAPRKMVEQEVGTMKILEEAANIAIPQYYVKTVLEKKIDVIGRPHIQVKKIAPGNPLIFKATSAVMPKVELPDYKKIKVKRKNIEVKKEKIEEVLMDLQKSRAKFITVTRPAQKNDKVEIDFKATLNKVPIEGGQSKNHPIIIGENKFVPGFEEKLIGMKEKDKKQFTLTFPKNYYQKNLAGKDVDFDVEMKLVQKVVLPELNDEFAKRLGKFMNLKDLKLKLEENLKREKEMEEEQRLELEIIDKILKEINIEIPDILVNLELDKMYYEFEASIQQMGGEIDKYLESIKKTKEDLKKTWTDKAVKRVKTGIILREIADKEKIKVTDQEIEDEINKIVKSYPPTEEIKKRIKSEEFREYTKGILRNRKVLGKLKSIMLY